MALFRVCEFVLEINMLCLHQIVLTKANIQNGVPLLDRLLGSLKLFLAGSHLIFFQGKLHNKPLIGGIRFCHSSLEGLYFRPQGIHHL